MSELKLSVQLGKIIGALGQENNLPQAGEFVRSAAVLNAPVGLSGNLRENIFLETYKEEDALVAEVYTRVQYAPYVELGTGPEGAAEHSGISPEVSPVYKMEPWWIHESQLDTGVAEHYHWPHIDTPNGRFYKCSGQPAHPFMYPALKDNEDTVLDILAEGYNEAMRKASK